MNVYKESRTPMFDDVPLLANAGGDCRKVKAQTVTGMIHRSLLR
jgi:hypothetical protein